MSWKRKTQDRQRRKERLPFDRPMHVRPRPKKRSEPTRWTDDQLLADDKANTIKRFVHQTLSQQPTTSLFGQLTLLSHAIQKFQKKPESWSGIQQAWANRRAVDILREKSTMQLDHPLMKKKFSVEGCMDCAVALAACARCLCRLRGEQATIRLVRWKNTTKVRVEQGPLDILFDPFHGDILDLTHPIPKRAMNMAKANGHWGEGEGPRTIGLHTIHDFEKFNPEKKK